MRSSEKEAASSVFSLRLFSPSTKDKRGTFHGASPGEEKEKKGDKKNREEKTSRRTHLETEAVMGVPLSVLGFLSSATTCELQKWYLASGKGEERKW